MNRITYNKIYGSGAYDLGISMISNHSAAALWSEGALTLNTVRSNPSLLADINGGMNIYSVNAFGRNTLVSAFGQLGNMNIAPNGGISFSNPTAGAYLGVAGIRGTNGGYEGITLSETSTMATVMGLTNTFTRSLINWGVRQATTPWGNSIRGLNKFSKRSGEFMGYYSTFVYGMQVRNAYNNGDRLHTLSNGLMSFYSIVATQGDGAGFALTLPLFIVDWTVGMDNFLIYNFNYGIYQSLQLQKGNLGVSIWLPGKGLR